MTERDTDRRLRERLENAAAPEIRLPQEQARLRRRLLDEAALEARPDGRSFWRLGAAGAAAAIVLIAIQLVPQEITAAEVLRGMEAVYDADTIGGKVHYLRQLFRGPGQPAIEEERWSLRDGMLVRILMRDVESGEVIGHTIADGDRVWSSPDSRIRIHRQLAEGPSPLSGEAVDAAAGGPVKVKMRLIVTTSPTGKTTDNGERVMQSFLLTDVFDTEQFKRRTPRDVLDALLDQKDVEYDGMESAPTGEGFHVLKRRARSGSFPLKMEFPESYISRLQELSSGRPIAEMIQQDALGGDVTVTPLEAFETIKVLVDSSRIHSVAVSALEDGMEVYRAEKVFLSEAYLDPSPSLFDPTVYDLEPLQDSIPDMKERP